MSILATLRTRFRPAVESLVDSADDLLDMIRPAQDPRFGDYQANFAMPLGKRLRRPPREVAEQIVAGVEVGDLCERPEVAGPGFINLRLKDEWLISQLGQAANDRRLAVSKTPTPRTLVIDYSSPNVAKAMHVGHIRSTVIGDALYRALQFMGHHVVSDNHLGDWGTQFGMIIHGYKHFVNQAAYAEHPVRELGRLYKLVNQLVGYRDALRQLPDRERLLAEKRAELEAREASRQANPKDKSLKKVVRDLKNQISELAEACQDLRGKIAAIEQDAALSDLAREHPHIDQAVLRETARLHEGDAENLALWREFLPQCREDMERIYERIDVRFDYELGESFYHDRLEDLVTELVKQGLVTESDGAACVFLDGFETPMIVRKKDGAYLYATTDLATIRYRMETWNPDAILYVVDHRQSEHFSKLFACARLMGYKDVELRHVSFGTVLGQDKRPYRTRSGDVVGLEGLLDESIRRAHQVVSENDDSKPNGPELSEAQRAEIARTVGHAALKYADLSHNRTSDYEFSYDKMVSLEGNTATYMQYSYARTRSIFERGGVDVEALRNSKPSIMLREPVERDLALELLQFADALDKMLDDYRPNVLTAYLFSLATRFSRFYEKCAVLKAETEQLRDSRLLLCDLTGRTIKQGLSLLGIGVVDKM
ncbi:MAG: arginine--tRNA ligase [Planctomycetota bacterium]